MRTTITTACRQSAMARRSQLAAIVAAGAAAIAAFAPNAAHAVVSYRGSCEQSEGRTLLSNAEVMVFRRDGSVVDLVVSPAGQVAWTYRTSRASPTYEVHVGDTITDRSATVLPGSLAIAGLTAYWTRDGAPQSAVGTTMPRV
jgi:hypothetical protein